MKLSLEYKINLGFGLALLILAGIGFLSYWSITQIIETDRKYEQAHKVSFTLAGLTSHLKDVEIASRGYLMTGQTSYLDAYQVALELLEHDINDLYDLPEVDVYSHKNLGQLESPIRRRLGAIAHFINLRQKEGLGALHRLNSDDEEAELLSAILRVINRLQQEEQILLEQRSAAQAASIRRAILVVGGSSLVAVAILIIAIWVIRHDLKQRRRSEAALQESEALFRATFEEASMGIGLTDMQGGMLATNLALQNMLGYSAEEFQQLNIGEITHPDDVTQNLRLHQELTRGERQAYQMEKRYLHRNGQAIWGRVTASLIRNQQEQPLFVIGLIEDISERKQAEAALAQEHNLLRTLIDALPDYIFVKDLQSHFVIANRAMAYVMGATSPDELTGKTDFDFQPEILATQYYENEQAIIRSDNPLLNREEPILDRTLNEERWLLTNRVPLRNRENHIIGLVGVGRDITKTKQMTERLRESEERTRLILQNALDAIVIINTEGIITHWNLQAEQIFGWSNREVVGQRLSRLIIPSQYRATYEQDLKNFKAAGEGTFLNRRIEITALHRQGHEFPVEFALVPAHLESSFIFSAFIRDITQRKQVEEALRQSEERFALAVQGANDGIWDHDLVNSTVYWSPRLTKLLGYDPDEIESTFEWYISTLHPDDTERIVEATEAHLKDRAPYDIELRGRIKSGEYRWFRLTGQAVWDETGRPLRMAGSISDITERKQAQETLAQERNLMRTLLDNLPDLVFVKDRESRFLLVNQASLLIGNRTEAEIIGQTDFEINPPDLAAAYYADDQAVINSGQPVLDRVEVNLSAGQQRWFSTTKVPLRDTHGQIIGLVGMSREITERKQMEAALTEERNLLRTLIDSLPDSIYVKDVEGRHLIVNQAGLQGTGAFTLEDMIGKTDLDLYPLEAARQWHSDDMAVIRSGQPLINQEECSLDEKGNTRWELTTKVPLCDSQGQVTGLVGVSRDITERKQAEKALRENEALLRTVIDATPDWIFIKDQNHRFQLVNRAYARLFDLAPEALVGKTDLDMGIPENIVKGDPATGIRGFWPDDREVMEQGETKYIAEEPAEVNGQSLVLSTVKVPLKDATQKVWGILGFVHDITDLKRVQNELQQAKEAAESAAQVKSEFLANMSHEIRTPLNAIIGMTSLLLDTPLSGEQHDFAETIRSSGDSLLTIINDILDFSKIEAGKLELEQQPFNLRQCIEEALDLVAIKATEKKLDLLYSIGEATPGAIIGDVTRLRQILVNLLSNAVKFTEQGEVVVSVRSQPLRHASDDGQIGQAAKVESIAALHQIHVSVRDTGIGIPADRMGRLFQSFSQVDASTTRKYGGSGLGLSISKYLSELMGGAMWVESTGIPGEGSTFHFSILAEAAPEQPSPDLRDKQPVLADKQLLIVDDNAANRLILAHQAQAWGMHPRAATSGQEALSWIMRGDRFDIAILDMQMPDMDGLTLAAEIRHLEESKGAEGQRSGERTPSQLANSKSEIPLVMLTSLGQRDKSELITKIKFAAFLTKPVKPVHLYNTLLAIFEGQALNVKPEPVPSTSLDTRLGQSHPLRILLAEDNAVNQKVALLMLERMGYRADIAANGLEVLAALQRQTYDVVLMDMQMPEMDGLEATHQIHETWPAGDRPWIIAMTANALQGDRERYLAAGMDDYVSKPVRPEELAGALHRCPGRFAGGQVNIVPAQSPGEAEAEHTKGESEPGEGPPVLDVATLNELRQILGEQAPRMIRELIDLYLQTALPLLNDMRTALQQEDGLALYHAAHALKPGSAHLGALQLATLCAELETRGKAGQLAEAATTLAALEAEFSRVETALMTQKNGKD